VLSLACAACLTTVSLAAEAAHTKAHKTKTSAAKAHSKSRSTAAHAKKPTAKSSNTAGSSKKALTETAVKRTQTCKTVRVKTAKGVRSQRRCTNAPAEKALHSPIGANVMGGDNSPAKQELKARTIPDRAYAVDGYTFFHQGRKYRVLGIDEQLIPAGSDLAKQRLQVALDSGPINVEPLEVDENGTMRATVRIGGRNLADVLNSRN
jgi:hypothetical protein